MNNPPKETRPAQIVHHLLNNDPFSRWMGVEVLEVKEGFCKISCSIKEEMQNGFNVTHGGIVFSLADSALAFASATYGRVSLPIDNSISFARKTVAGDILIATCKCISLNQKTGIFEVKVTDADDAVVAVMKGTVYRTREEFTL